MLGCYYHVDYARPTAGNAGWLHRFPVGAETGVYRLSEGLCGLRMN